MPIDLIERGTCTTHPHPDWWSSDNPAERQAAAHICQTCPVLALCAQWRDQLPATARVCIVLAGSYVSVNRRYDQQAS